MSTPQELSDRINAAVAGQMLINNDLTGVASEVAALDVTQPPPPPPPPPGPEVILAGPDFRGIPRPLTADGFHAAFGKTKELTMHGVHNVRVVDDETYAIHAPGNGDVSNEKVDTWFPIHPVSDIEVGFTVDFTDLNGDPTDMGMQSKFGWGFQGYHSGKAWPGGSTLWAPDWMTRVVWNNYTGASKFGLYIYTPTDNPGPNTGWDAQRGSTAWGGHISRGGSSGYRRLVRCDPAFGPEPGRTYRIAQRVEGADGGHAQLTLLVNDTVLWSGPLGPLERCNRLVETARYGGGDGDGPDRDTEYKISDVVALEL